MTRITCQEVTPEGNSDEIYVMSFAVVPNLENPALSPFGFVSTPVYEDMKVGVNRPTNLAMWGLNGTAAAPIVAPQTAPTFLVIVRENDGERPEQRFEETRVGITGRLNSLPTSASYEEIRNAMHGGAIAQFGPQGASGGEFIGMAWLEWTREELEAAKSGRVVQRILDISAPKVGGTQFGPDGRYHLLVQMGREGVPPISR
jgi:hypothetical protein